MSSASTSYPSIIFLIKKSSDEMSSAPSLCSSFAIWFAFKVYSKLKLLDIKIFRIYILIYYSYINLFSMMIRSFVEVTNKLSAVNSQDVIELKLINKNHEVVSVLLIFRVFILNIIKESCSRGFWLSIINNCAICFQNSKI